MKKIIIAFITLTIASCGVGKSKSENSTQINNRNSNVEVATPELAKIKQRIKGKWYTKGENIATSFYDSISVSTDAYGSDTSDYVISYHSCESDSSSKKSTHEIVYLKLTSKSNGESCFSIENSTNTSLDLMSLKNGNLWSLTRKK